MYSVWKCSLFDHSYPNLSFKTLLERPASLTHRCSHSIQHQATAYHSFTLSNMPKVQRHHVVAVATFQGVVSIIVPWMMAVMIRKLIGVALMGPSGPSSAPSQGIFRVVFLDEFSFQVALGFVVMAALIMAFGNAFMSFLAQKRSEDTGFTIRRQILQCVTSSRGGGDTSTDIHRAATDMIVNVKLVQDFQAYDESFLIVYNVMLIFSLLLLFFFTWYGALVAIAVLFTSEAWCAMVERFRKSVYTQVQQNTHRLNSRLLDVIKNGTVIKIMGTVSQEQEVCRLDSRGLHVFCYFLCAHNVVFDSGAPWHRKNSRTCSTSRRPIPTYQRCSSPVVERSCRTDHGVHWLAHDSAS